MRHAPFFAERDIPPFFPISVKNSEITVFRSSGTAFVLVRNKRLKPFRILSSIAFPLNLFKRNHGPDRQAPPAIDDHREDLLLHVSL